MLARRIALALVLFAVSAVAVGCRQRVALNSARYAPSFSASDLGPYRGKVVVLRNVENVDNATRIFSYPGDTASYGGPVLTSYFWYCLRAAFERIGVGVYAEDAVPPGVEAPVMDVRLVGISERAYQVGVGLSSRGAVPLRKTYGVPGPPIVDDSRHALEQRAYFMMDALFSQIVHDPEFYAAFMAASAPAR